MFLNNDSKTFKIIYNNTLLIIFSPKTSSTPPPPQTPVYEAILRVEIYNAKLFWVEMVGGGSIEEMFLCWLVLTLQKPVVWDPQVVESPH